MKSCSVAKLKEGLSRILEEVAEGVEIIVTDHNKPVAKISSLYPIPPLPEIARETMFQQSPVPLSRKAQSSVHLVRRLREEE